MTPVLIWIFINIFAARWHHWSISKENVRNSSNNKETLLVIEVLKYFEEEEICNVYMKFLISLSAQGLRVINTSIVSYWMKELNVLFAALPICLSSMHHEKIIPNKKNIIGHRVIVGKIKILIFNGDNICYNNSSKNSIVKGNIP